MKYVVIESNNMYRPFGGCFEIDHETDGFVFFKSYVAGDLEIHKISRKRIIFFTDKDVTPVLKEQNQKFQKEHLDLKERMHEITIEFKRQFGVTNERKMK
jgi:hypothetical protein